MPRIYKAIDEAMASGVPRQTIAPNLVKNGYPPALVYEAVEAWMRANDRSEKNIGYKQWLKKYKSQARPLMVVILLLSIIASAIALLKPWPIKIMVDSAFGNIPAPGPLEPYTHTTTLILLTSLLTLAIFIAGAIFGTLKDYISMKLGIKLNHRLKEETLRHILHLPLFHKERLSKGDYVYRQNALTNSISDLVSDSTVSITQSAVMILGVLGIMITFDVKLTLITVVLIPFLFILIRVFGPRLGQISRKLTQVSSAISSDVAESLDNSETVQSFNLEEKQIIKTNKLWQQDYALTLKGMLLGKFYQFSNSLLVIIATSAVMYFGGTAVLQGELTVGQLLIFMIYMGYLLGPVESLATEIASRNQKKIDISRVYEVLADHEGVESRRIDHHFHVTLGKIEYQNVSYSYNDSPLLNDISLVIQPGEKVGFVGASGSGKTTLLKMLPLFVEPQKGKILIDDTDIQSVAVRELRYYITWISQAPQLFNGTLLDNLLDGNIFRQITQAELNAAVEAANASEFIEKMPERINTLAGESGSRLSGGQKQRLAIARGLLKNSPIVCMDEPTAALDEKSEELIKEALPALIEGKTVLMVTHRRPLLDMMDTVYLMKDGRLSKVEHPDALDKHLEDISGEEMAARKLAEDQGRLEEAERQLRDQQKLAEANAEAVRRQEKLNIASPVNSAEDGVIYIQH